ncbi:hypothetical protein C7212DRAFT_305077 [Tuber magnatum]|uniref:Uncharacterized protein n=1 Tax=Tuber magnatum TaxID=42249 RepID=A0A317SZ59_9PEZI|nr:hypothetical protein C7212DRAFT_305077 [Tuber magnatum]
MEPPPNMSVSIIKQNTPVHMPRERSDDEIVDKSEEQEELRVPELRNWFWSHPRTTVMWYGSTAVGAVVGRGGAGRFFLDQKDME